MSGVEDVVDAVGCWWTVGEREALLLGFGGGGGGGAMRRGTDWSIVEPNKWRGSRGMAGLRC